MLISYWRPQLASMPCGLVRYLDRRGADGAVLHIVWNIGPDRLWSYITTTLTEIRHLPPGTNIAGSKISLEDLLRALWRLYSLRARIMPALSICESALDAVLNSAPSVVSPCVIALIKANIVDALHIGDRVATGKEELSSRLAHPILAIETVHKIPRIPTEGQSGESSQKNVHNELQRALHGRTIEARFQIMSELLECCTGPQLPYNILKTLSIIKPLAPPVRIHGTHQNRLAATIGHLFRAATARQNPEVLEAVLNLDLFNVYAPAQDLQKLPRTSGASQGVPWMDHPKARRLMKDFLVDYEESLISSARPPAMVARVKTILHGIDTLHPSALP
ncbi:hypothetical protein B0H17DRAFT_345364 [Mycena rosella]|uniref:Uncharacterized protein n=1 Tax=Mycena rosella TaxID=1033263 RepID=A0AAD7G5I2_MYCRO|nr:hypothetical protein B0H17DRAFT_345364 [Mycena rosella]